MNTPNTLTPTDLWLAGCKGQALSPDQKNSVHHAEGSFIRALFYSRLREQSERKDMPAPTDESEQRHWRHILAKLRQQGGFVLARPQVPVQDTNLGRLSGIPSNHHWFALVASVAVLAVGLSLFLHQHDNTQDDNAVVLRGNEAAQRVTVPADQTTAQVAEQIEAILQQQQLPYQRTELNNGGVQIQAKVPKDSPATQELQTLGLSMPGHERLNVLVLNQ